MADINKVFRANPGIILETILEEHISSIKMIKHIFDIVNKRFNKPILYSAIYSNENLLEIPISKISNIILYYVVKSDYSEYNNIIKVVSTLIRDEIDWCTSIELHPVRVNNEFNEFPVIKKDFCIPILSNKVDNRNGKFLYTFLEAYDFLLKSNIKFYAPKALFFMRKIPILISGMNVEDGYTIEDSEFARLFYVIKLNNLNVFSELIGCDKVDEDLLNKFREDDM